MTEAFFNQFASWREFQRNNNHIVTLKMKTRESLKNYVNYFQSQMTLVYNCNEDVAAATFISGLQVTHPFYKHLVKNDVTRMRDILVRAQKYIQIEVHQDEGYSYSCSEVYSNRRGDLDYIQPLFDALFETRPRD